MIQRTHSVDVVTEAVAINPQKDFDVIRWLDDEDNIAFVNEDDKSVGLFECEYPGLYTGHYFFQPETRGRAAKTLAQQMLREVFINHGAKAIRGLTPLGNRAARWMTRQIGFISMGPVETEQGPCELFVLTPDRFYHTLTETKRTNT